MYLSTPLDYQEAQASWKVGWWRAGNRKRLSSFFGTLSFAVALMLQFFSASAQSTPFAGCSGCTANDDHVLSAELVQLNPAYATDATQPQYISLPATCTGSSLITGYLKITFDQNATTRYGIQLAGNILVNGVYSSTFSYKDADLTNSGTFVKVISNTPITYTCGTQLSLQNLFIGWGNSAGSNAFNNASTCDSKPHCEQLPLKPTDPPIIIVTPLSANFTSIGSCASGNTAQTYSFDALAVPGGTTGGTLPYTNFAWVIKDASDAEVGTMSGANPTFNFSDLGAGTYTVQLTVTDDNPSATTMMSKSITVVACCSASFAGPALTKVDNCDGTTTITAKDGSNTLITTGLTWSNGATGNPITVSTTSAITATYIVNGCTSGASNSITPTPKSTPLAPVLTKVDNCNGTTTITAEAGGNTIAGSELTWTGTSQTGNPITVSTTDAITVTRTVNDCPSDASNSIIPAPKTKPNAPVLTKVDNCNGTSTITAKDGANTIAGSELTWTGTSQTGNPITVSTTDAIAVTRTVNDCPSDASNSIIPAPKTKPNAPVLTKVDNCNGTSTITAKDGANTIAGSELTWTGTSQTGNPITVSTTDAITVMRTVDDCPSDASNSITPAPKTKPNAPVLTKVDNCNGTSTITAKDGANTIAGSELTWTGTSQTGNPITVSTTNAITVTRTVNDCPSDASNSITPAPKTTPGAPVLTIVDNCGSSVITAKDGSGSNASLITSGLTWSNSTTGNPITVYNTLAVTATVTMNGCMSGNSNSVTPTGGSCSHIFPTQTTCCNYVNGPTTAFAFKQVCLTPSYSTKGNTVSNATPGVFFYYGDYTATATGAITIKVTQSWNQSSILAPFNAQNENNVRVADSKCNTIALSSTPTFDSKGNVTLTFKGVAGTKYVISVKYDTKSIIGSKLPSGTKLSGIMATYTFGMSLVGTNNSLTSIPASTGTLDVTAGCSAVVVTPTGTCPTTTTQSIVSSSSPAVSVPGEVTKLSVSAFPNPYTDKVKFVIQSPVSGQATLDVFNMLGQKIKTVFQGNVVAGIGQSVEYNVPKVNAGNLMYILRVGNHQATGKLIH